MILGMTLAGCGSVRLEPGQVQKQNAYLHYRTNLALEQLARQADDVPELIDLAGESVLQSMAILNDYGMPKVLPASDSIEQILSDENKKLTAMANEMSLGNGGALKIADEMLGLGIAIMGIFGGAIGGRIVNVLRTVKDKNNALQEIIKGNEIFKKQNPASIEAFKQAQQYQSPATREIVVKNK